MFGSLELKEDAIIKTFRVTDTSPWDGTKFHCAGSPIKAAISRMCIDDIKDEYPDEKRPGLIYGQLVDFVRVMAPGDYVVIPSEGSSYVNIGTIGNIFTAEPTKQQIFEDGYQRLEAKKIESERVSAKIGQCQKELTPIMERMGLQSPQIELPNSMILFPKKKE